MTRLAENSVRQGRLSFAAGWWPLHALAALCVLGLFAWRLNVNHRYHPARADRVVQAPRARAQRGLCEGGGMSILQRYFTVAITQAVAFVLVAFLGLSAFMDLTGALPDVGKNGYLIQHAFLYVVMRRRRRAMCNEVMRWRR